MLPRDDTIAAIATAGGAIGIVRVSGSQAAAIGARVLRGSPALESHQIRRCVAVDAQGRRLDEVLAIWMRGPRSFTGEDVLELQGHGGQATSQGLLAAVCAAGARPAAPGEFTRRAFRAGRLSLLQAEAVAEVVAARGSSAARLAQAGLAGELDAAVGRVEEEILGLLAQVEAGIDFPEEGLAPVGRDALAGRVRGTAEALVRAAAKHSVYRAGRDGAEVAIVGLTNVGKSSLLNALAGRERALVSERPGTTRDVVEVRMTWAGEPVLLLDTAGLAEGDDELEQRGMALGLARAEAADLRIVVVDGSQPESERETRLLASYGAPRLVVQAKSDLPAARPLRAGALAVSSKTGVGLDSLPARVLELLGLAGLGDDALVPQTVRQQRGLEVAAGTLERAARLLENAEPLEVVSVELEAARAALLELRGLGASEEVLEVVFRTFCIGK